MGCKNCKHCHEYHSLVLDANGEFSYRCDLGKGRNGNVVGYHDIIGNKDYFSEFVKFTKDCKFFEQKEPKSIVWKTHKENELSFLLENDEYQVKGGNKEICQLEDMAWFGVRFKTQPNIPGKIFYTQIDYRYKVSEELEDFIIHTILEMKGD